MDERIRYLFRKFLINDCSKEEFEEVFHFLQNEGNDPLMREELRRVYEEELASLPSEVFVNKGGEIVGLPEGVGVGGMAETEGAGGKAETAEVAGVSVITGSGKRRLRRALSLALVLVVLVAGGIVWKWMPWKRAGSVKDVAGRLVTQATHRKEYKYLLLPDSTQVWLNAASTLEFPESFGKGQRKVVLTGEAFFDVKHAEQMPFIIYTGNVSTEVLGTAFNIKAYPNMEKIVVSVKQGKVKVNYADRETALLTRGQQISIGIRDNSMKQKKGGGGDVASWQDGELVYDDYTIGDIITDLERVYDVEITVESPAVSSLRVSTAFKKQNGVRKAMEVLSELADVELVQDGGKYILK